MVSEGCRWRRELIHHPCLVCIIPRLLKFHIRSKSYWGQELFESQLSPIKTPKFQIPNVLPINQEGCTLLTQDDWRRKMPIDLMLKPACGGCGSSAELYRSTCKHLTLCVTCGKTMAETRARCYECGTTITRLIREYNVPGKFQ